MYQNDPYKGTRDEISGKDLEKVKLITLKEKEFRKNRYVEEMAHYAMLWLKYFRNENTSYYNLVNAVLCDEFHYSKTEISKMVNESIYVLKNKYNIDVTSYDPLILSSCVPFYQIKEDVK